MMIKSREIRWNEFIKLQVVDNRFEREAMRRQNIPYKYKSGTQWVCWDKDRSEFLPNCKGKLQNGINI